MKAIALAYSYIRFSSKRQGKGSSLYRQTHDTISGESPESWCARNGVTFDTNLTFRDLGVSAFTGKNVQQGALKDFLECVRTGRIVPGSYLLVEKLDRISREGVDEGMEVIKKILKAGISIVTLANCRVYGPASHKRLSDGLLELQMFLEQARDYTVATPVFPDRSLSNFCFFTVGDDELALGTEVAPFLPPVCGKPRLFRFVGVFLRAPRVFALACRPGCRTGNSGKTEAEVAAPKRQPEPGPSPRPADLAADVPAAAPDHPDRALLRIEQVGAPLPYVTVHVAQPQLVRGIRADPCWSLQVFPLRRLAERKIAVEVGLLGRQVVGRLIEVEVI
jgi:hypothetical protein